MSKFFTAPTHRIYIESEKILPINLIKAFREMFAIDIFMAKEALDEIKKCGYMDFDFDYISEQCFPFFLPPGGDKLFECGFASEGEAIEKIKLFIEEKYQFPIKNIEELRPLASDCYIKKVLAYNSRFDLEFESSIIKMIRQEKYLEAGMIILEKERSKPHRTSICGF